MVRSLFRLMSMAIPVAAVASLSLSVSAAGAAVPIGQPDPSFGSGGAVSLANAHLLANAVQSDGKVVVVGDDGGNPIHLLVIRYNANGSPDAGFNGGKPALGPANTVGRAVAIQPDGSIVVAGAISSSSGGGPFGGMLAERFTSGGVPDGGFGNHGAASALGSASAEANSVAIQSDGKIVVAGDANGSDGFPRAAFARFNASGSLDASFAGGAEVLDYGRYSVANSIAIQSDGKIVFGGSNRQNLQTTNVLAARLNANGSRDSSFAGGGLLRQFASGAGFSSAFGVAIQPDGGVVLAGSAADGTLGATALFIRLTPAGALDGSFGGGTGFVELRAADSKICCNQKTYPGASTFPGASSVVVSAGDIFANGYYDSLGRERSALFGLSGSGAALSGFGSGGEVLSPLVGADVRGTGLAVAPGGNLVATGFSTVVFGGTSSFTARYGGPFVTPPPPPPPPPVHKLKLGISGVSRSYSIRRIGRSGIKITVSCSAACRIRGSLTISYATAKRLHLAPRGRHHPRTITIGGGSATLRHAGKVNLVLRLSNKAKRALSRQRRTVFATASLNATSGKLKARASHSIKLVR